MVGIMLAFNGAFKKRKEKKKMLMTTAIIKKLVNCMQNIKIMLYTDDVSVISLQLVRDSGFIWR